MIHDQETICKIEQHCIHDKDTQVTKIEKTRHQRHRTVRVVEREGVRKEEKSEVLCSRLMMTQYFDKRTVCMTCRVLKFTVPVGWCWSLRHSGVCTFKNTTYSGGLPLSRRILEITRKIPNTRVEICFFTTLKISNRLMYTAYATMRGTAIIPCSLHNIAATQSGPENN